MRWELATASARTEVGVGSDERAVEVEREASVGWAACRGDRSGTCIDQHCGSFPGLLNRTEGSCLYRGGVVLADQ